MASLYIAAGLNHFSNPETYLRIMPPWLPAHQFLVLMSGITEVVLGVALFIKPLRRMAAIGIILLLIIVFPANVQMMLNYRSEQNPLLWLAILRLPLQLFLIWWAFQYTKPLAKNNPGEDQL
jgi:uncharacterized membrane protein